MDGQIFTPPYLLNPDSSLATRPNITIAPAATALPGDVLTVFTDTLIASFSIIRRGCAACLRTPAVCTHPQPELATARRPTSDVESWSALNCWQTCLDWGRALLLSSSPGLHELISMHTCGPDMWKASL